MRKLLAAVLVLGLVVAMKATSYAYTPITPTTNIPVGAVTVNGTGVVNMSFTWSSLSALTFAAPTIGVTGWELANNYLILKSTVTDATGGIQIYTNNRNATDGTYKFTGSSPTFNAAGLVNGSATTQALPMCWRASTQVSGSTYTFTIVQGQGLDPANPNGIGLFEANLGGAASKYACYLWMTDYTDPGYSVSYSSIRVGANGVQAAESTWAPVAAYSTVNIYLGANFANAMVGGYGTGQTATYQTTTLTLVAYYQ